VSEINWGRFIVGGIIASIIAFITDGLLHEKIVAADWKAVYDNLGASLPRDHNSLHMVYFVAFELGRGFIAMFLYVLMRPHLTPGPKTAALAGVAAWIAFSLTGPAQFIPLGFYSNVLWIKVGAFQLVTSVIAAIAGAAIYKDAVNPATAPGA
jgi:hypothetical protein